MKEMNTQLKNLFDQKKFFEIISIIDKIEINDRNSGILNLRGVCKLLSDKSVEALKSAIDDFREAYLREKNTQNGLNGLQNFINSSIDLFDLEFRSGSEDISEKIFDEIFLYFGEAKDFFSDNEIFNKAIIRVFKRTLDLKKVIFHLKKIIKKNPSNTKAICSYIYFNCFLNIWSQKEFLENAKILNDRLPLYSKKDLIKLKISKKQKINLAFISSDIRSNHSVTYFLKSVLVDCNFNEFNIFLYLNNEKEDQTTENFKKLVKNSKNIFNLKDVEAINMIRKDEIDIIIDLMGVTSNQRLALFKNRLAPCQINWCGYPNTTGLNEMDYIIADKNLIYENEKEFYSEKIIFLNNIWNCHVGFNKKRVQYKLPFYKKKYFTFGSFNNFRKINDNVIDVWSSILKKVANSKLILKASDSASKLKILEKFKKNDIIDSVEFLPYKKSFDEHLSEYNKIDLGLDTFPYNGVTTSFESIWMNVPVLTMKGYNFNSRCGESINKNIKLDELIAQNNKDYIDKAVLLACEKSRLEKIRDHIFKNAPESPLFNKKKFSNDFFSSLKVLYN